VLNTDINTKRLVLEKVQWQICQGQAVTCTLDKFNHVYERLLSKLDYL